MKLRDLSSAAEAQSWATRPERSAGAVTPGLKACKTHLARLGTGSPFGGTERFYGAGGEEMATSSLHVTDGVPRCPSRTT